MGPMGLNPPNIYVTSILVRSVQVLCTIGVITAERVAKKAKNEGKLPFYGYFLAIWVGLWRRDSNHSNIYWHPWFGPILSTFGCLEVSFAENSHLSLTRCFRGTSSFLQVSSWRFSGKVFVVVLGDSVCIACPSSHHQPLNNPEKNETPFGYFSFDKTDI